MSRGGRSRQGLCFGYLLLDLLEPLAPPPLTRREVGQLVLEARAAQEERPSEFPVNEEDGTVHRGQDRDNTGDLGAVSEPLGSEAGSKGAAEGRRGSRAPFAWILSALAVISIAIALRPVDAGETAVWRDDVEVVAPAPERPSTNTTEVEQASGETIETKPAPVPSEPPVASIHPARLSIVVFPWGDVWIDGKPRGAAPVKDMALKPGRHKISAGQSTPTRSRVVRLGEGERRTLEFDLTQ